MISGGPLPSSASQPNNPAACNLPQRSTRGASKQRRDQINIEIQRLRDLLPLSESIKDRLYQLQIMSLGCIYMRKHRYLSHVVRSPIESVPSTPKGIEVCKALRGFLLMVTRSGKMLHVSENASEYLGHSVEEIMCQGDSIYDLVDHKDHAAVQAELASGPPPAGSFPEERVFLCRLNLTRAAAKRQMQYHKFILLQGRYIHPAEYYQTVPTTPDATQPQPMFAAFCQPLINPENAEALASGNTNVFSSQHYLDMRFKESDHMCAHHLGYSPEDLDGMSWYQLVHPTQVMELAMKHRALCQEKEGSVLSLIRMQTADGEWIWLHTVMAAKANFSQEMHEGRRVRHVIHCYYQILSDLEAATLQANDWIYKVRHTYPAAFPCHDSPNSEQDEDHPLSPSSPFVPDGFQPHYDFSQFIKAEPFAPIMPMMTQHFQLPCNQIKVEIPHKQPSLSLFTPESSSPESSASFHSSLLSQPFTIDSHALLDQMTSSIATLPDLRDEVDEFIRQVEQPSSSMAPSMVVAPVSAINIRHSPQEASELYKYMSPQMFSSGQMGFPKDFVGHQMMIQRPYSMPECAEYTQQIDPFFNRKMSWAI